MSGHSPLSDRSRSRSSNTLASDTLADIKSTLTEMNKTLAELKTASTTNTKKRVAHWRLVVSPSLVTPEVLNHRYAGSGTTEDPYQVEFIPNDPRNPMNWGLGKKWFLTFMVAIITLAVAFSSSAYSGGTPQIMEEFGVNEEIATLGLSLNVLGFALGPLIWGPFSELFGRQILFFGTYCFLTVFSAGAAGSNSIATLIVLRFLAGAFGSSPLTNSGGVIADMFPARQRGLAMTVFAAAPFMGPTLGPIVGAFVGETVGWRWVLGVIAIFVGVLWIVGTLTVPETYAPVLLRKRAAALSKQTGRVYQSGLDVTRGPPPTVAKNVQMALTRPWILLFREPIVLFLSIYLALIYGTLYMSFGAFPIVYGEGRGWSQGKSGLAFLGVAVGMLLAVGACIIDNRRYIAVEDAAKARGERGAPPEARLPPCMVGCICIPVGLFIFAWTNYPSIHWSVSMIFMAPFGFGMVTVFLSVSNYLVDSYTIYAASVLAANAVLRALFATIFPLFTTYMYHNLGIHWASSIPAFLALACVPFPFLFYKYGPKIRQSCKYAREADEAMQRLQKASDTRPLSQVMRHSMSKHDGQDLELGMELGGIHNFSGLNLGPTPSAQSMQAPEATKREVL